MALRSPIRVVMAAVFIAACTVAPTATGSPDPASVAPSAPAVTAPAAPSVTPTESPEPSAGIVCPSDLPTSLASVEELADASCYGTTELTIDGWLAETGLWTDPGETDPAWTNPFARLFADSPTAGEWLVDFMMTDPRGQLGIEVVSRPKADIDLTGNGRFVTLRGHFNDDVASACVNVQPGSSDRDCSRLFVVTSLETHFPFGSPVCPPGSPITVEQFLAADVRCFIGKDVRIRGWEDVGEGFGGTGPIFYPTLPEALRLADAQLASGRFEDDPAPFFFVWTIAGSGIQFDREDQKVIVTGRLGHPAAQDCRAVEDWAWSPPESWAPNFCGRIFVVTAVEDR
jgi:hypothetical protein